MNNKIFFTFDKNNKAQKLKKIFLKKFKNSSLKKSKYIVVCGGDGFMLSNIRKFYKFCKPFYGINCGTFGFLMNRYNSSDLIKRLNKSKKVTINPLKILARYNNNKKKLIAINEISLFRQSRQTALLNLIVGQKKIIKRLVGDGVLICTPAGSTAYNLSINGPILSLNSGKLSITPISPFRPRRWRGKIISNNLKIKVNNINKDNKRPVAAVADNVELRNVKSLNISLDKKTKINLLFDKDRSLIKRIKLEQVRKKLN